MTNLESYFNDGANYQAQAVLCLMKYHSNIEESYNHELRQYDSVIKVARWENCREQGHVFMLHSENHKQLNIAVFEHRNSDDIHAVKWEQNTINTPTINSAVFGDVYKDKYDTSFQVAAYEISEMVEWLRDEFNSWWLANRKENK